MLAQIKMYAYLAVFASVAGLCGYGYYLYNKVDSLEAEKEVMQATIEHKEAEMQATLVELKSVRENLGEVTAKSEELVKLAEKRRLDVNWLQKKLNNLGSKIATAEKPETYEGEVNSEFVNVLSCIEVASGSKTSVCQFSNVSGEDNEG